jgi:glyceraldehyde 3-phosphate dehydrogenase
VDGPHDKWTRGRAAAANFVPTSTGAAQATTKVLTDLEGKFDGVAVRGPTPAGSLSDLVMLTREKTTADAVKDLMTAEADGQRYKGVMGVSSDPLVSSDVIADPHATVVDLNTIQVIDGDLVKLMTWYDNEWGYVNQMIRTASAWTG